VVRQSGLGKGLSALIPTAPAPSVQVNGTDDHPAVAGQQLVELPVAKIRPNQYQPRDHFDDEALESLAESIRTLGVLQPVLVRADAAGDYELVAGGGRWGAAPPGGLGTIPAGIRRTDDARPPGGGLVEKLPRPGLDALEGGAGYQQMINELSLTHDEVASRVGKSRVTVSNALRLLQLSPSIQKLVKDAQISAGHARALLPITDRSFQESLARRVVTDQLSVRAVEEAVRLRAELAQGKTGKASSAAKAQAKTADRPAGLVELEELLGAQLDTRVSIELGPKHGRIVIDFADVEDLERIFLAMSPDPDAEAAAAARG
jgi:ParB family transcriptional regulator, chromosome partitioning protein